MRLSRILSVFALLMLFAVSAQALETRCVVVGPEGEELSYIARQAADAQKTAGEIEAYLRNSSLSWESLAFRMALLDENIRQLRKSIDRFERSEPKLSQKQAQQLERLKTGLATLTIFASNTNRLIGEKRLLAHWDTLRANAKAMEARAGIIRDAARNLRKVDMTA